MNKNTNPLPRRPLVRLAILLLKLDARLSGARIEVHS